MGMLDLQFGQAHTVHGDPDFQRTVRRHLQEQAKVSDDCRAGKSSVWSKYGVLIMVLYHVEYDCGGCIAAASPFREREGA
jgi:hypothetical protein